MANDGEMNGTQSQQDTNTNDSGASIDIKADTLNVAAPLKEKIADTIDSQKQAGADKLTSLAGAITGAAAGFDEQMPKVAQYIREAGGWVEQSASDVREQKFEEILSNVGNFAKNKPALAFGVAALSGFALSRFLKSERPAQHPTVSADTGE